MIKLKHFTYLLGLLIILASCKNDKKEKEDVNDNKTEKVVGNKKIENKKPEPKKVIEPIDNGENTIFPRLIFNEDTKLFASVLSNCGLTNVFSDSEKQYTVFAPSNDAFKSLPTDKFSSLLSDTELLSNNMKGLIVEGKLDYSELSSKVSSNGGSYKLKTLSGKSLKASLHGSDIIIKDSNGVEASVIGGKNINTENGTIFIINNVLTID